MKVDGTTGNGSFASVRELSRLQEEAGYDGLWAAETNGDPFLPCAIAAEHTSRVDVGTGIAVAFARNPMTLAYSAHDLNTWSGGRFVLGLGSQVKAHVERRFSMPWSRPAARMRELVMAMRAIWASWDEGTPLDFQGEFYTHTLMTPFFAPPPSTVGTPRVFVAGVGAEMTAVAGEVADGLLVHPFTSAHYLRTHTLPALSTGLYRAGRGRTDVQVTLQALVALGESEEQLAAAREGVRRQVAFYASTPSYLPVLEAHGWGDLGPELTRLSKAKEWAAMAELLTDEVVDTYSVSGSSPEELAQNLVDRYGGLLDRVSFATPYATDPPLWPRVAKAVQALTAG